MVGLWTFVIFVSHKQKATETQEHIKNSLAAKGYHDDFWAGNVESAHFD